MTSKIRYTGHPARGYTARRDGALGDIVQVRKNEAGRWAASFAGNPYSIAHPECIQIDRDGAVYQKGNCPRVEVPGDYPTRDKAAEAAWAHKSFTGEYVKRNEEQRLAIIRERTAEARG